MRRDLKTTGRALLVALIITFSSIIPSCTLTPEQAKRKRQLVEIFGAELAETLLEEERRLEEVDESVVGLQHF